MWNYIRPDAPVNDDPAEHLPDRPEDCEGECQDCGRRVPLGHMVCNFCTGE